MHPPPHLSAGPLYCNILFLFRQDTPHPGHNTLTNVCPQIWMMLGITNYLKHVNCVAKISLVNHEYFSEFCLQRKYGAGAV